MVEEDTVEDTHDETDEVQEAIAVEDDASSVAVSTGEEEKHTQQLSYADRLQLIAKRPIRPKKLLSVIPTKKPRGASAHYKRKQKPLAANAKTELHVPNVRRRANSSASVGGSANPSGIQNVSETPILQLRDDSNELKEQMASGQSNILVSVRVRPLLQKEIEAGCRDIIRVLDEKMVVVLDPGVDSDDVLRVNRSREKQYAFDHAFDGIATQMSVFRSTTKFLLESTVHGFNATVFAYGATGSGKTYTMLGTPSEPGIMFLTLQEMFNRIDSLSGDYTYTVTISYLEIYNEMIRDLLTPSSELLDLREDPTLGMKVCGITEIQASNVAEVMDLLRKGNKNRTQEPTTANQESSRSHAVMQMVIEQKERVSGSTATIKIGKLSMIDLAGSERAAVTQNRGIRLLEGANINRSLLALGNCINALGEKNYKGSYIPYRDSKLTRLLKDSLGGNCRTVMIANVSPSDACVEETLNTLKYANRAKNIKTQVTRNEVSVAHHISQYSQVIADLLAEVCRLKEELNYARLHKIKKPTERDKPPLPTTNNTTNQSELMDNDVDMEPVVESVNQSFETIVEETGTEDDALFDSIRAELQAYQLEKVGIRKQLASAEASLFKLRSEQHRKKQQIDAWESEEHQRINIGGVFVPKSIRIAKRELQKLVLAGKKREQVVRELKTRMEISDSKLQQLYVSLRRLSHNSERQELLSLYVNRHALEMEKVEAEASANLRELELQEKENLVERLRLQLKEQENVIRSQKAMIAANSLQERQTPLRNRSQQQHIHQRQPISTTAKQPFEGRPGSKSLVVDLEISPPSSSDDEEVLNEAPPVIHRRAQSTDSVISVDSVIDVVPLSSRPPLKPSPKDTTASDKDANGIAYLSPRRILEVRNESFKFPSPTQQPTAAETTADSRVGRGQSSEDVVEPVRTQPTRKPKLNRSDSESSVGSTHQTALEEAVPPSKISAVVRKVDVQPKQPSGIVPPTQIQLKHQIQQYQQQLQQLQQQLQQHNDARLKNASNNAAVSPRNRVRRIGVGPRMIGNAAINGRTTPDQQSKPAVSSIVMHFSPQQQQSNTYQRHSKQPQSNAIQKLDSHTNHSHHHNSNHDKPPTGYLYKYYHNSHQGLHRRQADSKSPFGNNPHGGQIAIVAQQTPTPWR